MSVTAPRELCVWIDNRIVGSLRESGSAWSFRYDPAWLGAHDAFDLAPALPRQADPIEDGGSARPVQWFFDNLLPEEGARTLLAQDARISEADAFGLLGWYGAESAGALTLLPQGQRQATRGILPLGDAALSDRIRRLPRQALTSGAPKRMSMAGAQHKLAVVVRDGQLFEPEGLAPSTHILKPDHVDAGRYPHSVANEWFCMVLADEAGLMVPQVALRRVPEPVYLVDRFDRFGTFPEVRCRHVLDGCQLLSLDRVFKYQQATTGTMARLIELCREKARSRQRLFQWVVFNLLIGNGDAHLKNLSFFVGGTGIGLTPHYDLLSTTVYLAAGTWGAAELSWPMPGASRFGDVRRAHVLAFGDTIGVPARVGGKLLDEMLDSTPVAMDSLLARIEVPNADPRLNAGELRLLRHIRFGVTEDMVRQTA